MNGDVQAIEKQLQFWQDCKKAVLIAEQAKTIEAGHQQVVDRLLQKSDVLRKEIEERTAGLARFANDQQLALASVVVMRPFSINEVTILRNIARRCDELRES